MFEIDILTKYFLHFPRRQEKDFFPRKKKQKKLLNRLWSLCLLRLIWEVEARILGSAGGWGGGGGGEGGGGGWGGEGTDCHRVESGQKTICSADNSLLCLSVYLSLCQSVRPSVWPSDCLRLFLYPSIFLRTDEFCVEMTKWRLYISIQHDETTRLTV